MAAAALVQVTPVVAGGVALTPVRAAATAAPAPKTSSPIRDEHVRPVPGTHRPHAIPTQIPSVGGSATQPRLAPATSSSNAFLTLPYSSWHSINSVFDHCNPDYSTDQKVCRFDGAVATRSAGVDPSFSLGYAQTPGGGDYLYYDGHNGMDYGMAYENVLAAADGVARLVGVDSVNTCFGQNVIIDHPNGFSTRYAHLSATYVTQGASVARGQVIGQSGNTGCSSGPHLHFGVYVTSSWTAVDPYGWWGAAGADPWPSDQGDLWLTGSPQYPLPAQPGNVSAVANGGNSATVSWTAPSFDGGTPITGYTITSSPGGVTATAPGTATSGTIANLPGGTAYTFSVAASNAVGSGFASAPSNSVGISEVWSAGFDLSQAPKTLPVNEGAHFTIKVTNNGTQAWPAGGANPVHLSLHYATAPGGFPGYINSGLTTWLADQRFSLPADVAPGQTVSLDVSPNAPNTVRSLLLEAEMVREGQFWFDQWQSTPIQLTPAVWAAGYDLSDMPRNWLPNQAQSFPLVVTNNGNQTWRSGGAAPVHLGIHFASAAGGYPNNQSWLTDQRYALPSDLAPGARTTIMVTARSPQTLPVVIEAEMVQETQFWFADWAPLKVMGGQPAWTANYDLSAAPRSWTPGQTQSFPVRITNSGNQVWPSGGPTPVHLGLHFATAAGGWPASRGWLTDQRVNLPANLPPGASATLTVSAIAPSTAASVLEVEAVKEGTFWFGEWSPLAVTSQPVWDAGYDLSTMPQTWSAGQSQTFPVKLTNLGNQSWPAGGANPVHLGLHFATRDGGWPLEAQAGMNAWLTDQRFTLPADVAPGASVVVSVTATAPAGAGASVLEAEMVKEGTFWFKDWAPLVLVPGPALWAAGYDLSGAPRAWAPGQSQTFQLTVTNTGNQPWPSGGQNPVHLGIHFANAEGGVANLGNWATDQRVSLPQDLPPGAHVTLTVTATAPAGAVPLVLEAEMVQEQVAWFASWAAVATSGS